MPWEREGFHLMERLGRASVPKRFAQPVALYNVGDLKLDHDFEGMFRVRRGLAHFAQSHDQAHLLFDEPRAGMDIFLCELELPLCLRNNVGLVDRVRVAVG